MRISPAQSFLLIAIVSISIQCHRAEAVPEDPLTAGAEDLLVRYIRIDTSNPPGRETAAAEFFRDTLQKHGIESRLLGADPARQSIYARLVSGSQEPALILLHHLDVVPANPAEWSVPPFSGTRSGGYIWGRGALDIKSLGIANLLAFVDLKLSGVKLKRDVIFLGVADEEAGGLAGAKAILESHPELFQNAGYVLNEGGANETIVDRINFWGIEVDQKLPLWIRVTAKGMGGHAAAPSDRGGAVAKLLDALAKLRAIPLPYRLVPLTDRQFDALATRKPGIKGELMRNPEKYFDSPEFEKILSASTRSLFRDTMAITRLQGSMSVNSIPAEAWAEIDFRLLPDRSPDEMLELVRATAGEQVVISVILEERPAAESPSDTELYAILERAMREAEPESAVGPMLSSGTSDSRFFRQRGITTYGISPFKVNYYDSDAVHGIDEKIRAHFFVEGTRLMRKIVRRFCADASE